MKIKAIPSFTSLKFPELRTKNFLITQPDDKGFAQEQVDKIFQGIYIRSQMRLKPWEKDSFNNIYKSSGKSNHQILQDLKDKINKSKTLNTDKYSNNNYYKENELKTISNSQEIARQIKSNIFIRKKFSQPSTNIKTYTIQTKQICQNNMLSELIKLERNKMRKIINEYEKSINKEMQNLNKDILNFEQYATNEMFKQNQRNKYINRIETFKRNLNEEIKNVNQEYHYLKAEIIRTLNKINDKKIYVSFVHKLFGGEPELGDCNLEDLIFQNMNENELHSITNMVESEMKKSKPEDNILITSTDEELLSNINKIDLVFKFMEENILKTLAKSEDLRNEIVLIKEEDQKEIEDLKKKIHEREIEYKEILKEYLAEKENSNLIYYSNEENNIFFRKLFMELFECTFDVIIKNRSDIDEYNVIDKIIKPSIKEIKDKERKIDNLILEMEKYSKQNKELFNISVTKIKNENKILKFHQERYNREFSSNLRNEKIFEKINKIMVTGKYKYKVQVPLNIIQKRQNNLKQLKTEPSDYKLLYY
jgi:hypothetical protein